MNFKALSFGAVLGFLVAVVPSCGSPACGPANCGGCCDSANKCVPLTASNSNTACGQKGATCANCAGMNQVCNTSSFVCEFASGQGGGGGTTGGGTGGGSVGGGTGGGVTGGGTGGGVTGGGAGNCDIATQDCPTGNSCMVRVDQSGTSCFPGVCDVVTQNCAATTDKCSYLGMADGGGIRGCAPTGAVAEGQPCTMPDNCAKGMICVGPQGSATCQKFCYRTSDCTGTGQCLGAVQIPGTPELPATCVTLTVCDPLSQSSCPSGQGCYLTQTGPSCLGAGTVALNGTCGQATGNCTPGNLCLVTMQGATSGTCKPFCNLDGGMPNCGAGSCAGLQGVPYGVCP